MPEIGRFLADTDVALLLDSGHLTLAGGDPIAALRIATTHLKDIRMTILEGVRAEALGMIEAWQRGIFCALGEGDVDRDGFCRELSAGGYDGWVVIEQDRVLTSDAEVRRRRASIRAARVLWTTGTGLSAEPSRTATLTALRARAQSEPGAITIHDLDHRRMFWTDEADAARWAREALAHASVAVGNRGGVAVATGTRDPLAASAALLELGVELAIVKLGPDGVLARTADRLYKVAPVPVEVVCGLGAGDVFGAALVYGLLGAIAPDEAIAPASAAGSHVAGRCARTPCQRSRS